MQINSASMPFVLFDTTKQVKGKCVQKKLERYNKFEIRQERKTL